MANHKSSEKRIRQTVAKRAHNRLFHKTARNAVKALRNTTDKSAAEALLPKVTSMLDKLAKHNIVQKFVADACKRLVRDCYPMLKFKSRQNLTALRYLYRFTEILLFE
jgi:small subunit ribosomal protein S20